MSILAVECVERTFCIPSAAGICRATHKRNSLAESRRQDECNLVITINNYCPPRTTPRPRVFGVGVGRSSSSFLPRSCESLLLLSSSSPASSAAPSRKKLTGGGGGDEEYSEAAGLHPPPTTADNDMMLLMRRRRESCVLPCRSNKSRWSIMCLLDTFHLCN